MNLLAIETSTELASVALLANNTISELKQSGTIKHAQVLLPMIDELLANCQISCAQLDGIVFGRGPGSFTGLRIACSVAKGLAYAQDLPIYPVSSLVNIAYQAFKQQDANVLALLDARMQELYWGFFVNNNYKAAEKVDNAENILFSNNESLVIAGIGYENFIGALPQSIKSNIKNQYLIYPDASAMIELVQKQHVTSISIEEALPVYVRNQVTN